MYACIFNVLRIDFKSEEANNLHSTHKHPSYSCTLYVVLTTGNIALHEKLLCKHNASIVQSSMTTCSAPQETIQTLVSESRIVYNTQSKQCSGSFIYIFFFKFLLDKILLKVKFWIYLTGNVSCFYSC